MTPAADTAPAPYTIRRREWSVGPDWIVEKDGRPIIGTRPHASREAAEAWIAAQPKES